MSMFADVWNIAKTLVKLADDLQKYNAEVKEIRIELRNLTMIVHALAQEIRHNKAQTASDHEKLTLQLENNMLQFEKRLLPSPRGKK